MLQLSVACCFATLLVTLQLTGAVLIWREQPLTMADCTAGLVGLVLFLVRAIGGVTAWSVRRSSRHETVVQRRFRELKTLVRQSGLELPAHLDRIE